ncbi:hypothetical protein PRK78_005555 [Emydomyces testavorans]|uniref:SET domain-containing protein n=1 Tax=Emydomyces testavorans TaxID=2070801 RepID=A0AAF0IKU4_9EURO|nr:hypothetical protein PRK78_005555 [Emydomyces testavorans]
MAAPNIPLPPPPVFPDRPDLFNEVEWGPLPSNRDIARAYRIWHLQDGRLEKERRYRNCDPVFEPEDDSLETCLVRNVYESLLQNIVLPLNEREQDINVQYRAREYISEGESDRDLGSERVQGWSYQEIFTSEHQVQETKDDEPPLRIEIDGVDINSSRWKKADLQKLLRKRNLGTEGTVPQLKRRLYDHEHELARLRAWDIDQGSLLPRQDLSEWGFPRQDDYMLKISTQATFSPLEMYTWAILLSPYNPAYWTSRAYLYYQMGYFDLALGDAYRAQLLCEVLINPLNRNSQPGLYVRTWDAVERHILQIKHEGEEIALEIQKLRGVNGVNAFIPHVRRALHHIICLSLLALQCWADYKSIENDLPSKVAMKDRDNWAIQRRQKLNGEFVNAILKEKLDDPREFFYESHYGHVNGKLYPFCRPIDRTTDEVLLRINEEIIGKSQSTRLNRRKIEVRINLDGQLGVFATEHIPAGEIVYVDEPSIRGHLHDFYRTNKHHCENCKRAVNPEVWSREEVRQYAREHMPEIRPKGMACDCCLVESEPLYWCLPPTLADAEEKASAAPPRTRRSARSHTRKRTAETDDEDDSEERQAKKQKIEIPSCLEIAIAQYHYRACGRDWKWLHDAMRPVIWPNRSFQDVPSVIHHTNERHGTILSLLLREVFDITLRRRETDKKPHLLAYEIDELLPLMGADKGFEKHLFPFSYAANIRVPFDILQSLGVNIFRDLTFDTWVIQLVLRKLLINAIPWDEDRRRADVVDTPESKELRRSQLPELSASEYPQADPSIKNLYIFPGVSMFNNTCPDQHNVIWDWDLSVPNRIVLWANADIRKDDELALPYAPMKIEEDFAQRMFGIGCRCRRCRYHPVLRNPYRTLKPYGDFSSESPDESHRRTQNEDPGASSNGNNSGGNNSNQSAAILGEEESSELFLSQRAMTPRPEDEGEYDEADFEEAPEEVKEHSGEPFNPAQVNWHANKLRTALKAEAEKLPRHRLKTTESKSSSTETKEASSGKKGTSAEGKEGELSEA